MASEIHVGDIGTVLLVTIKDDGVVVDLSTATTLVLSLKKPNGISYDKTPLLYTDGADGIIKYTSVDGDFDQAGAYKLQATVTLSGGVYHSSISDFKVYKNLD